MNNHYETIGVDTRAGEDVIRDAIRTTRKRYRQVAGSPNKEQARNAEVMMDRLAAAEETLLDADKRRAYDAELAAQRPAPEEKPPVARPTTDWEDTARSYLANGQPRNAAQAAKQATHADPESISAWTLRAYAALELKDYSDADFAASEAQRRSPDDAQIAGLLGDVYDAEHRYQDAERAFARAAAIEPSNPYWLGRVAWALSDQGRLQEALSLAGQITAQFPGEPYARKMNASMLLQDAEAALSQDRGGVYFTNKRQIAHVEQRLAQVAELGSQDEGVIAHFNEQRQNLENAKRRRFHRLSVRRILATIVLVIVTLVVLGSNSAGSIVFMVLMLGLWIWWTVERCWPRQWKINRRALGRAAGTGLQ